VLVEEKWLAPLVTENLGRFRQNDSASGELVHRRDAGIGRADLEQRLRPQAGLFHKFAINELAGAVIGHREERADEVAVVAEDVGVEVEDAHVNFQMAD
jgi:hypothetical protein